MYLSDKKNTYELNQKSTNCMLLKFSVPGGARRCFVRDSGTRGKEG